MFESRCDISKFSLSLAAASQDSVKTDGYCLIPVVQTITRQAYSIMPVKARITKTIGATRLIR
jgi:hypothetical protein